MISIIIPAYNEAGVIERTLTQVIAAAEHEASQIIVVCNGCTDTHSRLVSRFQPKVQVLQLDEGSKSQGLEFGRLCSSRVPSFLHGRRSRDLRELASALTTALSSGGVHAVSPQMICELGGVSWPVRSILQSLGESPISQSWPRWWIYRAKRSRTIAIRAFS